MQNDGQFAGHGDDRPLVAAFASDQLQSPAAQFGRVFVESEAISRLVRQGPDLGEEYFLQNGVLTAYDFQIRLAQCGEPDFHLVV